MAKSPLIPKGQAMALHLTQEYRDGLEAGQRRRCDGVIQKNPYSFLDEYTKHYAWDIGSQIGFRGDSRV